MGLIETFIEAEAERKKVQEQLNPLYDKMSSLTRTIEEAEKNMSWGEKKFINQKLWENLDEKHQQDVLDVRADIEKMMNGNYSYSRVNNPFDPFHDEWHLITYKQLDDGKIQLQVSCRRREGTISGIYTFLDTYWTVPFDIKEMGIDN